MQELQKHPETQDLTMLAENSIDQTKSNSDKEGDKNSDSIIAKVNSEVISTFGKSRNQKESEMPKKGGDSLRTISGM